MKTSASVPSLRCKRYPRHRDVDSPIVQLSSTAETEQTRRNENLCGRPLCGAKDFSGSKPLSRPSFNFRPPQRRDRRREVASSVLRSVRRFKRLMNVDQDCRLTGSAIGAAIAVHRELLGYLRRHRTPTDSTFFHRRDGTDAEK